MFVELLIFAALAFGLLLTPLLRGLFAQQLGDCVPAHSEAAAPLLQGPSPVQGSSPSGSEVSQDCSRGRDEQATLAGKV